MKSRESSPPTQPPGEGSRVKGEQFTGVNAPSRLVTLDVLPASIGEWILSGRRLFGGG